MSRDPVVWWSFVAAFGFMVSLVLAANLFADGVRDAFDPRAQAAAAGAVAEEEQDRRARRSDRQGRQGFVRDAATC